METELSKEGDAPRYPIESVDRAIRLLSLFKTHDSLSLADISAALDVTRSSAHRLMAMFLWHGYAEQDPRTKQYSAGPDLLELSLAVTRRLQGGDWTKSVMQRVADELSETVHLVALNGTEVSFLDGIESGRALRAGLRVGQKLPAHATASGKVLLAALPNDQVEALFPADDLPRLTSSTVRTRAALLRQLDRAREDGYAVNSGESEPGLTAVSAVVRGPRPLLNLAVAVAIPSVRADARLLKRVCDILLTEVTPAPG